MEGTLSPPFAEQREVVLVVAKLARRYSCTPWEVLNMDPEELAVNLVCMAVADQERYQMVRGLQKKAKKSLIPLPVPTIDLGDL